MVHIQKFTACLMVLFCLSTQAYAMENGPIMKLSRGAANLLTSPLEYGVQFNHLKEQGETPATQLLGGLFLGTCMMGARIVTGALEIVTFPLPIPEGYEPIMEPATAWDDFKKINHL